MEKKIINYEKIFKALGDKKRLEILSMICGCSCEICSCDILDKIEIGQPTLSYHLKQLSDANIIIPRKDKNKIKYHLNNDILLEIANFFNFDLNQFNSCQKCK